MYVRWSTRYKDEGKRGGVCDGKKGVLFRERGRGGKVTRLIGSFGESGKRKKSLGILGEGGRNVKGKNPWVFLEEK